MLRRRWPVVLLVLWSAFVWLTRISNAWNDAAAATSTKVGATVLSLSILTLAAAAVVVLVRARQRTLLPAETLVLRLLAGWTALVWVVRAAEIALADYSTNPAITSPTAFKIVHLVLGLISLTLAGLTWRVAARERQQVSSVAGASTVSPGANVGR